MALPVGTTCFLALVGVLCVLHILVYALELAKATRKSIGVESETLLEKLCNPSAMNNASAALTAAPLAGLLILYVTFRAKTQLIEEDEKGYVSVQLGMVLLTGGILLRAGDGFSVRVESIVFGNISEKCGAFCTYVGYLIVLVGLLLVKSDAYSLSTAGKAFTALAVYVMGCLILSQFVPLMSWLRKSGDTDDWNLVSHLQAVRSSASFAPMVMLVLFYVHFLPWASAEELPQLTNGVVVACTVGVFGQGVGVLMKLYDAAPTIATVIRLTCLLLTYVSFAAALYCVSLVDFPSAATHNFVLMLYPIAVVKLVIVIVEEFSERLIKAGVGEERVKEFQKIVQSMLDSIANTMLLALLLLYVHFKGEFFLEMPGSVYIESHKGLDRFMYLLTISVYVLLVVELVKVVTTSPGGSLLHAVANVFTAVKFVSLSYVLGVAMT